MNGKNSDWLPSDTTDRAGDNLSYLFDAYNLQQHVNFATRITNGFPKSCIDLVASNLQDHQVQLEPAAPLGSSDHLSIVGSLDITPPPSTHPSTHPVWTWSWNPENLEALRSNLAVTELLPPESNTRNCDDLWAYWRDTLGPFHTTYIAHIRKTQECCLYGYFCARSFTHAVNAAFQLTARAALAPATL